MFKIMNLIVRSPNLIKCNQIRQFQLLGFGGSSNASGENNERKEYAEERMLGYSREQMFDIVANVSAYHEFVPWCTTSRVIHEAPALMRAEVAVGYGMIKADYECSITYARPQFVKSTAYDTPIFSHLVSEWKFLPNTRPGAPEQSCLLNFDVSFAFKSASHSQFAHLFFDNIVHSMVNAFLFRARAWYGEPTLIEDPKVLIHKS